MLVQLDIHPVLRALDRWSDLWNIVLDQIHTDKMQNLGLVKYASEYALLLKGIAERAGDDEQARCEYLERKVVFDTAALHRFVQQLTTKS